MKPRLGKSHKWYSPIEGQYVTKSFWEGWKSAILQYYPCEGLRLVNSETGEVVENIPGNGVVQI